MRPGEIGYEIKNVAAALWFDDNTRRFIHDFKFHYRLHAVDDFVDFLEAAVRGNFAADSFDAVSPIPSSLIHRWIRGYNQCEYLAKGLAKRLGIPYFAKALKRVGFPRRQSSLKIEERKKNVIGTFKVVDSDAIRGKKILLVDDIMTTGATLAEAMNTLLKGGALEVRSIALAKTQLF